MDTADLRDSVIVHFILPGILLFWIILLYNVLITLIFEVKQIFTILFKIVNRNDHEDRNSNIKKFFIPLKKGKKDNLAFTFEHTL